MSFIGTLSVICVYTLSTSITVLILVCEENQQRLHLGDDDAFKKTLQSQYLVALLLIIMISPCTLFVCGLTSYHTWLICIASTTNEALKYAWLSDGGNPFRFRFVLKNFLVFLLKPGTNRLINFKRSYFKKIHVLDEKKSITEFEDRLQCQQNESYKSAKEAIKPFRDFSEEESSKDFHYFNSKDSYFQMVELQGGPQQYPPQIEQCDRQKFSTQIIHEESQAKNRKFQS